MIEPTVALTLFDKLLTAIGLIRDGKRNRTKRTDEALSALYIALAESRAYIVERSSGKRRNRNREFSIAKLWHAASVPLREIDRDFAQLCFIKGGYWMDPETWNKNTIRDTGIAIDNIFEETRKLLMS